jgi:hypothetical protein
MSPRRSDLGEESQGAITGGLRGCRRSAAGTPRGTVMGPGGRPSRAANQRLTGAVELPPRRVRAGPAVSAARAIRNPPWGRGMMTSLGSLLRELPVWKSELERRHVFRTAIAYLVGVWIMIEVAATIFPLTPLPSWSASLVVGLAAAGFPFALFLSWVYDLTFAGVVRTEDPTMPPEPPGLRVAPAMGVIPQTEHAVPETIAEAIGEGAALLVLDNCKHLVVLVAPIVAALTTRFPGLRILATSREPLRGASGSSRSPPHHWSHHRPELRPSWAGGASTPDRTLDLPRGIRTRCRGGGGHPPWRNAPGPPRGPHRPLPGGCRCG